MTATIKVCNAAGTSHYPPNEWIQVNHARTGAQSRVGIVAKRRKLCSETSANNDCSSAGWTILAPKPRAALPY
jgi:hypothetical protein